MEKNLKRLLLTILALSLCLSGCSFSGKNHEAQTENASGQEEGEPEIVSAGTDDVGNSGTTEEVTSEGEAGTDRDGEKDLSDGPGRSEEGDQEENTVQKQKRDEDPVSPARPAGKNKEEPKEPDAPGKTGENREPGEDISETNEAMDAEGEGDYDF